MHAIPLDRRNAVLGAELEPVTLDSTACSPLDAISKALRLWAPTAVVKSVRLASPKPAALVNAVLTARVYAKNRPDDGSRVLQVAAQTEHASPVTATVQLLLPGSFEAAERPVYDRIQ